MDNLLAKIQFKNDKNIHRMAQASPLDKILNNPGLTHLAENIFGNLTDNDVVVCRNINQSSKEILDNPMFWLRKFQSLSRENLTDWIKVIQSVKNSKKKQAVISYLQWNLKKEVLSDLPCYSRPAVQDEFRKKILNFVKISGEKSVGWDSSEEDVEIVKILAPLTDNPNTPDEIRNTPIHQAAYEGHTEIVKILMPMTDNANTPNEGGFTPIHYATNHGHSEIVQLLAPLTDNPNAPGK